MLGLPFFSVTNLMSSTECHIDFWIGPHWLTGFRQNPTAYRCWFISLFSSGISGSVTSWLLPGSLPPTCRRLKNVRRYRSLGRSPITSEEWGSDRSTIITGSVMFSWKKLDKTCQCVWVCPNPESIRVQFHLAPQSCPTQVMYKSDDHSANPDTSCRSNCWDINH